MIIYDTLCPIIKTTVEKFPEYVEADDSFKEIYVQKTVIWFPSTESHTEYRHGGKSLKKGNTYTDWHGYMTSMDDRIKDAAYVAKEYSIDKNSTLELVVVVDVSVYPKLQVLNGHNLRKGATKYAEQFVIHKVKLTEEVVWSSKNTEEVNEELLKTFREKWKYDAIRF